MKQAEHQKRIREYVLHQGYKFYPAYLPDQIVRGKLGDCFDSSILNAVRLQEEGYRYCEGFAKSIRTGEWIYHAWLTDRANNAYDPTWKMVIGNEDHPVPTEYIGIELDIDAVIAFMLETKYKAVLENGWRAPALANKALPNSVSKLYEVYDISE